MDTMKDIYDTDSAIRAYRADTGGHFFDPDTMRFFGCRVIEATILKNDAGYGELDFPTLKAARKAALAYYGGRETVTL